jgi:hypothetical protein
VSTSYWGLSKLTVSLQDFTKCFPMFAAENKESFEQVYESTRAALRSNLWVGPTQAYVEYGANDIGRDERYDRCQFVWAGIEKD